jgi:hypothetical protein
MEKTDSKLEQTAIKKSKEHEDWNKLTIARLLELTDQMPPFKELTPEELAERPLPILPDIRQFTKEARRRSMEENLANREAERNDGSNG